MSDQAVVITSALATAASWFLCGLAMKRHLERTPPRHRRPRP